ncbi:MAG: protein kinase [Oscillospiraceae bacterium]|nr:protein kinase [Oscillospiraceae bacterium]
MKDMEGRLKDYEPLFETYLLDGRLGSGGFGAVYRLRHIHKESSKSAVKIITVPDESKYRQLRVIIKNGGEITGQVNEILEKYCMEIDFLEKFSGHSNIVDIKNYSIKEVDDIRRDILIQMEYLTDLVRYSEEHEMSEKDIIKLGIDICVALEMLQKDNILHRDIKPQNIFIAPNGNYKLGDFGIARNVETTSAATSVGTQHYVSPEVWNNEIIEPGDNKVDMYSLGLVLYELLNNWSLPFEDGLNRDEATARRLGGKLSIPDISGCGETLNRIVLKACAYDRAARYDNVTQMKNALIDVLNGRDSINVPPVSGILQNTPKGEILRTLPLTGILKPALESVKLISEFSAADFAGDSGDEKFAALLEKAVQGYTGSQNDIGNWYLDGKGVEKNFEKAVYWFSQAAEQGYASAQNNLGYCYYNGKGVEQDYEKAIYWYTQSANQGNSYGQYNLADCYYKGNGLKKDYEKSVYWLNLSADNGYDYAQNNLGNRYFNGEGVAKDYEKAIYWYTKAAERGNYLAQYNLADCYYKGSGAEKDYEKSAYWLTISAGQGYSSAQNTLGNRYYGGEGVAKDYVKAVYWYAKAAEQGNIYGQYNLADCYAKGEGIEQDYAKAIYWYTQSAEQGYSSAQNNLGNCYYNGEGTERDYSKAAYWYMQAAEQGSSVGQYNLANRYYYGEGLEKNYAKAFYWFTKSAEQGYKSAQEKLKNLKWN